MATYASPTAGGLTVAQLQRRYEGHVSSKEAERRERTEAALYYHASQWTEDQLKVLKDRGAPPVTTPMFARKINGFVGLIEKMRQDPKAFPRTGKEDAGAELATAALKYVFDKQEWESISPLVTLNSAVEGVGCAEISLEPGASDGDYDVTIGRVKPEDFFYDARSFDYDFADARDMGVAKWMDTEDVKLLFPDKEEEIEHLANDQGSEFDYSLTGRSTRWVNCELKQLFVVEHWYKRGKEWNYVFYCSNLELDRGRSYLTDEKGNDICRFIAYRAFVDQDGDSYSFHRNMKSLVDEINQRGSKALHLLAMRRIKLQKGAVDDVEELRRQAVRADGVIEYAPGFELEFEDAKSLADMRGQLEMREAARTELENFGPNPALLGQGIENKSGRAIALLQQAGVAELGPFILANRNWKIRVYRAVWNAIRKYWTASRWIRVTDAFGEEQYIEINGQQIDAATGMMQMVNQIGELDVDIKIDEGPDSVNTQADTLEVLQAAAAQGAAIPPQVMLELLPIPSSTKQKITGMLAQAQEQADPAKAEQAKVAGMLQIKQAEAAQAMQLKQAESEAELQAKARENELALQFERERAAIQIELEQQKAEMQLRMKQAELAMKMRADAERERERQEDMAEAA